MSRKTIVITGCSSGFGYISALTLASRGWHVFATVRKEEDAERLRKEMVTRQYQGQITPLLCDITQQEQITALARQVEEILRSEYPGPEHVPQPRLNALLNNAGTAYGGPIELMPLDDIRAQFELNVFAHIAVTQAFLPMLKVARGTIINVSSISGRISVPITGMYSASKHALEGMSDALRLELAHFGVRVVLIEPSSSPTGIWKTSTQRSFSQLSEYRDNSEYGRLLQVAEKYVQRSSRSGFPAQMFADTVVRILESRRPRARYGVPNSATMLMLLRHFLDDAVWDRLVRLALRW